MKKTNYLPVPPWDMDSAAARLKLLENDYNSLDATTISVNFTGQAEVRIGTQFLNGRKDIYQYLCKDLAAKKDYHLKLDLWGALKGRMAVRYELEWTDESEKPFKSYGVQVFQFDDNGLKLQLRLL
ncbi:MAG: DUF1348 family protein [Bacteroidota bacterium]